MAPLRTAGARRGVAAALGLGLLVGGAFRCGDGRQTGQATEDKAPTAASPAPAPEGVPRYLTGAPMTRPTRLRLLVPPWFLDVDRGTAVPVGVTRWLPRPGGDPLLLEEVPGPELGRIRVFSRTEARLPGTPRVIRIHLPALATVGASEDGAGLWVEEYQQRTRCALREVDLSGVDRRPPRQVACGTRPIGETPHGLWVDAGPDAFTEASVGSGWQDHAAVLLDPATLAERARFPRVELVDAHRVVVFVRPTDQRAMELRDLRTGQVTAFAGPAPSGYPSVWPPSPDGRYLPFSFEIPNLAPQVMDVWLLDLRTMLWLHAPSMPAYAALKATSLAWAQDGRLVLLGEFHESGPLLATWRPGETQLALLRYERPALPPGQPFSALFQVWPAVGQPGG